MTVAEAVAIYVQKKQEYGRDYRKVAQILNSFAAMCGETELPNLRARHVSLFLNRRRNLPATWYHKYMRIKGLLRYWAARGEFKRLPLPSRRASRPTEFYPHIFSRSQIARLLNKVPAAVRNSWCAVTPETMKNLILFLYGTGICVGEAIAIKPEHLDLPSSTVRILGTSGRADRILPFGSDIKRLIEKELKRSESAKTLFASKRGTPLNHRTLSITFRRLCLIAKVFRYKDAIYQPRLHDLRHTFAVHRITLWFQQKASVQKMLPLLAAYMGMVTVTAMEKYLLLAPPKYKPQIRQIG